MAKKEELFHALESEDEFDRFMTVTISTIGTALAQDKDRTREQIDEMAELTMHNIMFLCQEYHALVSEGKIAPVEKPKGITREQARKEVMDQLKVVEAFFSTAKAKQQEEKQDASSES